MLERTDDGRIIYRGLPAVFYKMINAAQPKGETEHASNETAGAAGPVCELCNRAPVAHREQPASRSCGGGMSAAEEKVGARAARTIVRLNCTVEELELRREALDQAIAATGGEPYTETIKAAQVFYEFLIGEVKIQQALPKVQMPNLVDVARADDMVQAAHDAARRLQSELMTGVRSRFESEGSIKSQQDGVKQLTTAVLQELRRFHAHHEAIIDAELASRKAL